MTMTDPTYEGSEKGIGWVCVVVSPIMFTAELNCHVCLKMIPQQVWQQYLTPFPPCLCLLTAGSIKVIFELYFPDWDWQVTAANRKGPCHTNHDISKILHLKMRVQTGMVRKRDKISIGDDDWQDGPVPSVLLSRPGWSLLCGLEGNV